MNILRRSHVSLKVSIGLAVVAVVLGGIYFTAPRLVGPAIPIFLFVHGGICLWASGHAFAQSEGPHRGCGTGIYLWLWFSLEAWFLGLMWAATVPAVH